MNQANLAPQKCAKQTKYAQGNRTTPSWVAFNDSERLIGDAAKSQASMNARNTVYDVKRLIGRKIDEPCVQEDMKLW